MTGVQTCALPIWLLQKMDDFEERALRNMTDAQRNALLEGGFAWMKALRDAIDD